MTQAARAAETAARASYGRLLAYLSSRTRDIAAAEDALADAFRSALETWPDRGIPDKPEAWLLTTARNRLSHLDRHARTKAGAAATLALIAEEASERASLPERLEAVLESIYAAYGLGWDNIDGADAKVAGFSEEALFLGSLLVSLLPESAEARGLRALMLYCEARAPARRDDQGRFVPFSDQNPNLWTRAMVIEAEQELTRAAQLINGDPAAFGRFQIEAAMQSVHIQRAVTGKTDWPVVIALYETLILRAPSIGAWVGRAAAYGEAGNPDAGLTQLDALPAADIQSYQPFWAVRADLLAKLGKQEEARAAYARAIGLSQSPAIKDYLTERMARPQQNASP